MAYSSELLSPAQQSEWRAFAKRYRAWAKRTVAEIAVFGGELIKWKDIIRHGDFLDMCWADLGVKPRSVQNYMRLHVIVGRYANIAFLPPSALYEISDRLAEAVDAEIRAGKQPTSKEVHHRIANERRAEQGLPPLPDPRLQKFGVKPPSAAEQQAAWEADQARIRAEGDAEFDVPDPDNSELGTPPHIVAAVREVFRGVIDLDPASSAMHNKIVQARHYFTKATGGLTQPWFGKVFMNSPYAKVMGKFFRKALSEFESGRVTEMILLVHDYTDTSWFPDTVRQSAALCLAGRINFLRDGVPVTGAKIMRGTVLFYFGPNVEGFMAIFDQRFGPVLGLLSKSLVMSPSLVPEYEKS